MPIRKVIVTTTINAPTEAIELFDSFEDYTLVVIGDRKIPVGYRLQRGMYVSPEEQERRYPRLSELLGWNCIQRRNIGFLIWVRHGSMRQLAAVDATATGDRAHGPELQRQARGGAGMRPDR